MRFKKILSTVLCTLSLLPMCVPSAPVAAEGAKKTIKILAIGNSYSNNATEYISRIAESMGLDIHAASLYKDGCMIHEHIKFYENYETMGHDAYYAADKSKRYIHLNINGVANTEILSMQEAIALEDWDFITLQQMPNSCDKIEKYWTADNPDLVTLYDYVKTELKKNGNNKCEILLHQGWSFSHEMSTENNYVYYPVAYNNTKEFFAKIEETVAEAAEIVKREKNLSKPLDIIPAGKAVQLAKDEFGFGDDFDGRSDSLYADYISHMSNTGRFLVSCVWIETLAKKAGINADVRKATFYPGILTKAQAAALASCAHEIVSGEADTVYGDWRAIPYESGLKLTHYLGEVPENGEVAIPETLGDKNVLAVGTTVFKYVDGVKAVNVPNTPIKFDDGALNGIKKNESIIIATPTKPQNSSKEETTNNDTLTTGNNEEEKIESSSGSMIYWIIGIVAVVVVAAAAAAFIFIKHKK